MNQNSHSTWINKWGLARLSGFDLAGQQNTQNWLRFGAGFETHIARGILSVMANTTTRGAAPNAWVNIGWRVEF